MIPLTTLATRPSGSFAQSGSPPRFRLVPPAEVSLGDQCIKFAARCGLFLDPWQQDVLRGAMGRVPGGRWAARNVGLLVPRQNGKGAILEARELFGIFVLNEPLVIHSAHRFDSSQEHFGRVLARIDENPDLKKHIASVYTANGKESIWLKNGCRLKFKARTNASMRGFSCETLILDEAMILPEEAVKAMRPALISRPEAQIWYTSSAGSADSTVLWRLVKRGREGASRLAYWEWGCPLGVDPSDQANWFAANPALGVRLAVEDFEDELANGLPEAFAQEHLGIWDEQADGVFSSEDWAAIADPKSHPTGQVAFAVDVIPSRSLASISIVGVRPDGLIHSELVDRREGTDWIAPRIAELDTKYTPVAIAVDEGGPAGSLIVDIERAGVAVTRLTMRQVGQAAAQFFDAVVQKRIRHRPMPLMDAAVLGATQRTLGDAWAWGRKGAVDVDPLVSASNALFVLNAHLDGGGLSPDDVYIGKF